MKLKFIYSFLLSAMCLGSVVFAQDSKNIFTYKVGDIEVILLVESVRQRDTSIILADDSVIEKHIPGGIFSSPINAFLVKTPKNTIMIDTGLDTTILEYLNKLKIDPADIDVVLLTNMHGDHIGGLLKDGKAAFPNAIIYLSAQEKNHWTSKKEMAAASEARQNNFRMAQNALAIYGNKVKTFKPDSINRRAKELLPGIAPIAAFGHTPGHTIYMISSGNDSLYILGDLINVMEIQIPAPDIATVFDNNSKAASETRKIVLKHAAENNIPIAGMHFTYPAIGLIEDQNKEEYKFYPVQH